MMSWLIPIGFVGILCCIFIILRRKVATALVLSCGLFALAGYGITGSPGLGGKPVLQKPKSDVAFDPEARSEALTFVDKFSPGARWMAMADSFARRGDLKTAAATLNAATRLYPNDAEIWVMQGNVLSAYAQSADAPAALYAYRKAAMINPNNPSLLYMRGVEAVQRNDLAVAIQSWETLLQTGPKSGDWRADVERLVLLSRQRAARLQTAAPSP